MADLDLMSPARRDLAIASLLTPLRAEPAALPGDLDCAADWHETAAMLDTVALRIRGRFACRDGFNTQLALFIAREVAGAAAEIRANLALEELFQCQNRP